MRFSVLRWFTSSALALSLTACPRKSPPEAVPSSATPPAPPKASATTREDRIHAGKELYDRYCKLCHGAEGKGYAADNAPSLVSKTFLESASDSFIARGIRVGRSNTAMAAYGKSRGGPLDEKQIRSIVAFLRSKGPSAMILPHAPATGDAKRGAAAFEAKCQQCHGTATTRGNALSLHNPELASAVTAEFLRYAIVHGRPETPMPAFGAQLKPAEVEDLVSFIQSLAPPEAAPPPVRDTKIPDNLPIVLNPKGKPPKFDLRDGRYVAADQVKQALDEKRRIVLVDARSPADWIQFRIPGAISIAYHDTEQLERIPNDGTWVVAYCACPHHASGEVVDALRKRNYKNTAVLDEGILVWKQRGYPLAGEAVSKAPPASSAPK